MRRSDDKIAFIVPGRLDQLTGGYLYDRHIVEGLRARGVALAVERIVPIRSDDYPTPARRPHNSRLDLTRLHKVFGLTPPAWQAALASELDALAAELLARGGPHLLAHSE